MECNTWHKSREVMEREAMSDAGMGGAVGDGFWNLIRGLVRSCGCGRVCDCGCGWDGGVGGEEEEAVEDGLDCGGACSLPSAGKSD